jgi:hypothetical protein
MTAEAAGFWAGAGGPIASAAIGLAGLPFQIAGQRRQQDIMRSGLEAQLRAQNAALESSAMLNREGLGAQMAEALSGRNFIPIASDLEFGRQKLAQGLNYGVFGDKELGYRSETSRRERSAAISPERQQAQRFENLLAMKRGQAQAEAPMAAMFGRKAPTNVSSMVV